MGIRPPLVLMPVYRKNWMAITDFNFETTQLELDTSRMSQGAGELASLNADFLYLKDQLGPD